MRTSVDEAVVAADEVIDAHLRGRYTLPFEDTPPILKRISADIAIFHIYGRRPEGGLPDAINARYKTAVRMLESIRDGKLNLGDDEETPPESPTYKTNKNREQRKFKLDD